jgi:hypothetical protein
LGKKGGRLMRQSLFAGPHLRASYRGFSSDYVIALLDAADEQDDGFFDCCCLHRPRRSQMKGEEY